MDILNMKYFRVKFFLEIFKWNYFFGMFIDMVLNLNEGLDDRKLINLLEMFRFDRFWEGAFY